MTARDENRALLLCVGFPLRYKSDTVYITSFSIVGAVFTRLSVCLSSIGEVLLVKLSMSSSIDKVCKHEDARFERALAQPLRGEPKNGIG